MCSQEELRLTNQTTAMLEASTALSSPQQSFYRQRFTSLRVFLSHHLAIWAQTLRADRAYPDLALTCIISCLSSPSYGCWAELCSAAYFRYNIWLLHINDEDELQVRLSFNMQAFM